MINTNKTTNNELSISASAGRSEKFHEATKRLSDYLYSLNLSPEENGTLIHLLLDEVLTAEHDAFLHGLLPSLIHAARLGSLDETATNNEKAIKAKEQKYNAQYNSKRTHMLCTTAPILLAAMGVHEDGSIQKLKDIEDTIKTLTDEQKQKLAQILLQ